MSNHLTPAQLTLMDKLYWDGLIDKAVAARVGCTGSTVAVWRRRNEYPANGVIGHGYPRNEYAVYLAKTDELLALGTSDECAKAMGMSRQVFYCIVCRAKKGTNKKYVVVKMDDEEDDDE